MKELTDEQWEEYQQLLKIQQGLNNVEMVVVEKSQYISLLAIKKRYSALFTGLIDLGRDMITQGERSFNKWWIFGGYSRYKKYLFVNDKIIELLTKLQQEDVSCDK